MVLSDWRHCFELPSVLSRCWLITNEGGSCIN